MVQSWLLCTSAARSSQVASAKISSVLPWFRKKEWRCCLSSSLFVQLIHMTATPAAAAAAAASCRESGDQRPDRLYSGSAGCQRDHRHDCDERQTLLWLDLSMHCQICTPAGEGNHRWAAGGKCSCIKLFYSIFHFKDTAINRLDANQSKTVFIMNNFK